MIPGMRTGRPAKNRLRRRLNEPCRAGQTTNAQADGHQKAGHIPSKRERQLIRMHRSRRLWSAIVIAGISACSSGEPVAEPTSYTIEKADLTAAEPGDICRTKDAAFLRNLLLRITGALPPGTSSFEFVAFNVPSMPEGKGMQATVRFRAAPPGGKPKTMYAAGAFDPKDCRVGRLIGGPGEGSDDPDAKTTFEEAGSKP